ncbi:MAG: hypothetical protein SOT58_07335 [Agathobacter sp.]|nr:hypothetical protein [Agathobacter sp.]
MGKDNSIKDNIIRKLTSRKLWAAIASFVGMLIVALGYTESEAATITALIMAGATVIAYIVGEGLVDAANVSPSETVDEETKEN